MFMCMCVYVCEHVTVICGALTWQVWTCMLSDSCVLSKVPGHHSLYTHTHALAHTNARTCSYTHTHTCIQDMAQKHSQALSTAQATTGGYTKRGSLSNAPGGGGGANGNMANIVGRRGSMMLPSSGNAGTTLMFRWVFCVYTCLAFVCCVLCLHARPLCVGLCMYTCLAFVCWPLCVVFYVYTCLAFVCWPLCVVFIVYTCLAFACCALCVDMLGLSRLALLIDSMRSRLLSRARLRAKAQQT